VPLDVNVAKNARDFVRGEGESELPEERRKLRAREDAVAVRVALPEGLGGILRSVGADGPVLGKRAADFVERVREPRVARQWRRRVRSGVDCPCELRRALEFEAEASRELVKRHLSVAIRVERPHDFEKLRL
jgi:hypothetical protein